MKLEIVTPTGIVCDQEVDSVVVPAEDGLLGILKDHTPLLASLGRGEVLSRLGGVEQPVYAVEGGFLQVNHNLIQILAEVAVKK